MIDDIDDEDVKKYLHINEPQAKSNKAIIWTSSNGHTEAVKLLLRDPRVDPAAKKNQAIRHASQRGHVEVVKLLLRDPGDDGNQAIRWANREGHTHVVRLLAQHFCDEELVLTNEELGDIIKNTEDGIIH